MDVGKLGLAGNAHHEGGPEHHVHTFQLPRGAGVRPGFFFVSSVRSIHGDLAGGLDGAFPIVWEGPDNVFGLDVAYLSRTASSGRHHSLGIPTWA